MRDELRFGRQAAGRVLTCEVAVVGAGLAGLVVARRLEAAGRDVLVLEAQERVGGRALDAWHGGEARLSLGAQWLGPGQDRLLALCDELGFATRPVHSHGYHLVCDGGTRTRVSAEAFSGPSLPLAEAPGLEAAWRELEEVGAELDLAAPHTHPRAAELDATPLEAWLARRLPAAADRRCFAAEMGGFVAAEPHEISVLHAAFVLASGGGYARLASSRGGAQDAVIARGAQELARALAAQLEGRCLLGVPVGAVDQGPTGVTLHATRLTVRAERAVVAVPPPAAARIAFAPRLPASRRRLHRRLGLGAVVKFVVVYPRPFWREEGLTGQVFSVRGPVHTVYDDSPPGATAGVLVGFLEGGDARRLARAGAAARRDEVLACLGAWFGPGALDRPAYCDKDWTADAWSQGGYGARFAPGQWTRFGSALREPVGRVHWAGSETSAVWNGYMEGAVRSGELAAREVELVLDGARRPVTRAVAAPVAAA